ncbi:ABC transporter permease subunit [Paenibacillus roseipurpureus]|uniref:ABC transporter permease subunit n=1 Tax=Paenibacillus roseopurpureus TaxID=2918901 RepID=A0AA96LNS7_9BACL|nr:ABC transporter permease subunit [Paenibacillus sp. MBLB1832]WNR44532.1 ABC transporter permease subunit [Paenibacillus sp. MBLB1832]
MSKIVNRTKSSPSFFRELNRNKALFLMVLPGAFLFLLLSYLPMPGVLIAFKDMKFFSSNLFTNFFQSKWVFFDNFKFFISSPDAYIITRNTILYNISFIVLGNVFAVVFAIMLDEIKSKYFVKTYQSAFLLPYILSWIILSYILYAFLSPDLGFVNRSILEPMGLPSVMWYSETKYWPFILFLLNTLKYTGYNTIIYLAAIAAIDESYYEAAAMDGASKMQQISKITVPMLSGIVIVMILLGVGRIFNSDFGLFFLTPMESGSLFNVTNVIDTYVFRALRGTGDIGMSAAAGLYQSVMGFVCIMTVNMLIKKFDSDKAIF